MLLFQVYCFVCTSYGSVFYFFRLYRSVYKGRLQCFTGINAGSGLTRHPQPRHGLIIARSRDGQYHTKTVPCPLSAQVPERSSLPEPEACGDGGGCWQLSSVSYACMSEQGGHSSSSLHSQRAAEQPGPSAELTTPPRYLDSTAIPSDLPDLPVVGECTEHPPDTQALQFGTGPVIVKPE